MCFRSHRLFRFRERGADLPESALARDCPEAEPFGNAKSQQQSAERDAHERHDERKPTGVGAGAGRTEAAEDCLQKNRC